MGIAEVFEGLLVFGQLTVGCFGLDEQTGGFEQAWVVVGADG